jgi:transcriptional regulator with XRE-family HTH domain
MSYHTPEDRAAFAARLKMILEQKQMSPYRLAKLMGVSQTIVGHWVKAENFPSPDNLTSMAVILETTAAFLQRGEHHTPTVSLHRQVEGKPSLPDPEVIRSARSQIAAACPDAVEVEITLRFQEYAVRL